MENTTRADAREYAEKEARRRAVEAGADEETLEVVDVMEVPLAYLTGNAVRNYLKVAGDLADPRDDFRGEVLEPGKEEGVPKSLPGYVTQKS